MGVRSPLMFFHSRDPFKKFDFTVCSHKHVRLRAQSNPDACGVPWCESAHSALGMSSGNMMLVLRAPDLLRLLGPGQKKPKTATPNEVTDSEDPPHTFRSVLSSESFADESVGGWGWGVCTQSRTPSHPHARPTPSITHRHSTAEAQREGPGGDPGCCGVGGEDSVLLTRRRAGGINGGT